MIEAHDLSKRYGGKLAVDHLSFTVSPGKVTGSCHNRAHLGDDRAGLTVGRAPAA
jgi:ABC-type Na+ transport system ATPase subunit NatA